MLGLTGVALLVGATIARRGDFTGAAVLFLVGAVMALTSRPVRLTFEVGQREKHSVVFSFDKFWGSLSVRVDGRTVVRDLRTFSLDLTKTYSLTVGAEETHEVRIEKHRARFLAGVRPQPVQAYVDDVLVAEGAA